MISEEIKKLIIEFVQERLDERREYVDTYIPDSIELENELKEFLFRNYRHLY